jgi:hypothetical protein
MKSITIKQPWAYLICAGIKDVENRSWNTHYRGRVFIHASAGYKFSANFTDEQMIAVFGSSMQRAQIGGYNFSTIIGSVEIVNCISEKRNGKGSKSIWAEKGCFHWILRNPVLFEKPVLNIKGRLSFWESGYDEIICPKCRKVCLHNRNTGFGANTVFGNFCHECEHCGYTVIESEYQIVKF